MASKLLSSLILVIFLLLPILSIHGHTSDHSTKLAEPFEFLKHLQGSHKGKTVEGVYQLKQYLKRFGYLAHDDDDQYYSNAAEHDEFDEVLESAVKTYQTNYNLEATGILDLETVKTMMMPRCGVADIINGTTRMRWSGKTNKHHHMHMHMHMHDHHHNFSSIHVISHYAFFPRSPKWPASKRRLTYGLGIVSPSNTVRRVLARAFQSWADVTDFTFEEVQNYATADIKIAWFSGDHGDGNPFDGRNGVTAHAFPPRNGRLHFDKDERWVNGAVAGAHDLESVAVHEIGHLLGLGHSSDESAIMYAYFGPGITKRNLQPDDIQGIQALYNF